MLFNSLSFALFLPVVFILYWSLAWRNYKSQNFLLLSASYFFYACWDWRFLFLLFFSTLLDYFSGIKMEEQRSIKGKRFWFWLSISINLSFLAVFKYYNFFATSFAGFAGEFGLQVNPVLLNIILPVGISFYTFHGLSYVIDIYKKKIRAERDFIDYAVFVSYFPLLVAGPIERATHLLPQIQKVRRFDYPKAVSGLRQILWGLFKKVVIADQCAAYANQIFNGYSEYQGSTLILGAFFFAIQIYCDFSGYSDIALGVSKLFGIDLLRNFAFPYFSRDIAEFWRRWHISLSSWFRDYLYIPLGGSKGSTLMKVRNTFIIFIVSGFWHGANWTFIIWGLLNALFIMPSIIFSFNRNNLDTVAQGSLLPSLRELLSMLLTFSLTLLAWVFFRSPDVITAMHFISRIFSPSLFSIPVVLPSVLLLLIALFMIIEWIGRENQFAIERLFKKTFVIRWIFYLLIVLAIIFFKGEEQAFIYFQF